jgi:site-specific DNA-cytosine methylase
MNVVSLFNGMNTGRQALENVGIKVNKYYSSEIKPYAIELTQYHFPDTIQVGDVTKWREWNINWQSIDLILSGSPCQDLSAAGKRAGINGKKSSLFFTFVEILNHVKKLNPKVLFLQENVGSASTTRRGRVTKGKSPCLMESNNNLYSYKDGKVRTVNQIEMERLQGFPDGYTSILSKAKAGSLLGDGWTLPVIEHIFKFIKL